MKMSQRITVAGIVLAFVGALALNACNAPPGETVSADTASEDAGTPPETCAQCGCTPDPIDDSIPTTPYDGDTCDVCTCDEDSGTSSAKGGGHAIAFDCVHVGKSPARLREEAKCRNDYVLSAARHKLEDEACLCLCGFGGPLYPICAGACKANLVGDFIAITSEFNSCMGAAANADPICPICKK
jgi:hypothetical protein